MYENGSKQRLFIISFFTILFCFFFLAFGLAIKHSSNFKMKIKSFVNFESGFKIMVKNRLQNEIVSSKPVRFLKFIMTGLAGKSFMNDVYRKENTLLKIPVLPDKLQIQKCCEEVTKFCDKTSAVIYFLLLPTKFQVNGGLSGFFYDNSNTYERKLNQFFCSNLSGKVIKLYDDFFSAYFEDVDFFYRTDNSLNSFGNFIVYRSIAKQMGISPFYFNWFKVHTVSSEFYGNLFNNNFKSLIRPDTVDLFEPIYEELFGFENLKFKVMQISPNLNVRERNSIFDYSKISCSDKNRVLFGDSAPIKIVETNLENGENMLIFSDGSADGLIQFLSLHYKKLIVVDLEQIQLNYWMLFDFLTRFRLEHKIKNFDRVLFLYEIESLSDSKKFKQLSWFC